MRVVVIAIVLVAVMAHNAAVGDLAGSAVVLVNAIGIAVGILVHDAIWIAGWRRLAGADAAGNVARIRDTHAAVLVVALVLVCWRRSMRESRRAHVRMLVMIIMRRALLGRIGRDGILLLLLMLESVEFTRKTRINVRRVDIMVVIMMRGSTPVVINLLSSVLPKLSRRCGSVEILLVHRREGFHRSHRGERLLLGKRNGRSLCAIPANTHSDVHIRIVGFTTSLRDVRPTQPPPPRTRVGMRL